MEIYFSFKKAQVTHELIKDESRPTYHEAVTYLSVDPKHRKDLDNVFQLKISPDDLGNQEWGIFDNSDMITYLLLSVDEFAEEFKGLKEYKEMKEYVDNLDGKYKSDAQMMGAMCGKINDLIKTNKPYNSRIPFKIKRKEGNQPLFTNEYIKSVVKMVPTMTQKRDKHRDAIISALKEIAQMRKNVMKAHEKAKICFEKTKSKRFFTTKGKIKAVKKCANPAFESAGNYIKMLYPTENELIQYNEACSEWIKQLMRPIIDNAVEVPSEARKTQIKLPSELTESKTVPHQERVSKAGERPSN